MSKKISITVYPTHSQYEALEEISKKTKIPMAVIIREGINMLLNEKSSQHALGGQLSFWFGDHNSLNVDK